MGASDSLPAEMSLNLNRTDFKFVRKTSIANIGTVKIMEDLKT